MQSIGKDDRQRESSSTLSPKLHKLQSIQGERTYVFCVPKDFVKELKIAKGDYMKCWINDNRLIMEKVDV
jgi:hypothetical protein